MDCIEDVIWERDARINDPRMTKATVVYNWTRIPVLTWNLRLF